MKTNKKIIIGNWKMNPGSFKEAQILFTQIKKYASNILNTDIIICPPYLYLEKLKSLNKNSNKIFLGAQDGYMGDIGAFTGEISMGMLENLTIKYIILGHSEKRNSLLCSGEDNLYINKKLKSALSFGLVPIFCIGESIRDENHEYLNFIKTQIEEGLLNIKKDFISKIIIAYEPIWAIGRGAKKEATPAEFLEISIFIRKILSDKFNVEIASSVKIIYGGSVNIENAKYFLNEGKADGLLIGRESLYALKFIEILKSLKN